MKILIVGSSGMLGSEFKSVLSEDFEVIAPERKEMDIVSWDQVIETLQETTPDVIVNCAGFTDVDACESEPFKLRKINVEGPRNLAQCSARFECRLVHISTDYVFDGQKMMPQPYFEDDMPGPISAYGKSKMESEKAVRENSPYYIIVRTAWLYGLHGPNFIKSIIRQSVGRRRKTVKVVDDQFGSPTWTYRLALQIRELILRGGRGTYHATAEGFCSRYECAELVIKELGLKAKPQPFKMKDVKAPAKRPVNCILENRLLKKQGLNIMRDWKEDLIVFLEQNRDALLKEAKSRKK
jgi:dTDP-4-dehydrorhamnose reductase